MEIRYIWVEEFRELLVNLDVNFQHQGDHQFAYKNQKLELTNNPKAILDFGPKVNSITAIAGKNGSGKSSICELIIHAAATYVNGSLSWYFPFKGIVCYGKSIFYATNLVVSNVKELEEMGYEVKKFVDTPLEEVSFKDRKEFHQNSFIYYANSLDWNLDVRLHNLTNISTQYLLGDDYRTGTAPVPDFDDRSVHPDFFGTYYNGEGYRATKFYLEYHDKIPASAPKTFILRNTYSGNNRYINYSRLFPYEEYSELDRLEQSILSSVRVYPYPEGKGDILIDEERVKRSMFQLYRFNMLSIIDDIDKKLPDYKQCSDFVYEGKIADSLFNDVAAAKKLLNLYQLVVDNSEVTKSYKNYDLEKSYLYGHDFPLIEYLYLSNTLENRELLKEFLYLEEDFLSSGQHLRKRITNYALAPYQSSGEKSYYSFFSRLFDALHRYDIGYDERKNIVLFIDEGEGGFHPDWKRKFLKWVIEFLNADFNKYNFQIILTTHSPYVLSDLSEEHILLVEKVNGKTTLVNKNRFQPFGANIHELLADAFFLTEGQIGEFAKQNIQEVIDHLNHWRKMKAQGKRVGPLQEEKLARENCKNIIGIIGDGIVRNKLFEMYFELFQEEEFLDREIAMLESRVNNLKKRRGNDLN